MLLLSMLAQFSLAFVLSNAVFDSALQVEEPEISIKVAALVLEENLIVVDVTNEESADSVWFHGFSKDSPIFHWEVKRANKDWEPFIQGWCGTGLKDIELTAGESVTMKFSVRDLRREINDAQLVRLNMAFGKQPQEKKKWSTIKSQAIDLREGDDD